MINLKDYVKSYPNFPKENILFRDFFPLLQDPIIWSLVMDELREFIFSLSFKVGCNKQC